MRLEFAESEMIRLLPVFSMISSLVTTRSRFSIRGSSKWKTCGSIRDVFPVSTKLEPV
jgi:hypothetical protein